MLKYRKFLDLTDEEIVFIIKEIFPDTTKVDHIEGGIDMGNLKHYTVSYLPKLGIVNVATLDLITEAIQVQVGVFGEWGNCHETESKRSKENID